MKIYGAIVLAGLAVGCDRSQPAVQADEQSGPRAEQQSKQVETALPQTHAWTCPAEPGRAPKGEYVANRIDAANATRDEAGLYEGPVWIDGALYFSDFTFGAGFPSRIQRLDVGEPSMSTVIENSGSNGLAVDSAGQILAATHDRKAISRYNPSNGEREILVSEFDGNAFNSPNDLTITRDGVVYFTDPDFQRSAAPGGQDATRVYRVEDGEVTVVEDGMANPNGVSLSPAEDVLYVAGGGEDGVLRAYAIANGKPGQGRDLAQVSTPDGMGIDCLGNVYVTEHVKQQVRVFTPQGEEIAIIKADANVTNIAFGGPQRKTLYLTGAGAVWSLELDVAGLPY